MNLFTTGARSARLFSFSLLTVLIAAISLTAPSKAFALSVDTQARLLGGFAPKGPEANLPEVLRITQSAQWKAASANGSMAAVLRRQPGLFSASSKAAMTSFFSQNLGGAYNDTRHLLYFFGGADVLYPALLFPNLEQTLLVGLERPGTILNAEDLFNRGGLPTKMKQVAFAFKDIVALSFFITKNMSKDLQAFGTTTMISVGLVANGFDLIGITPVSLDQGGHVIAGSSGSVQGNRIEYVKPDGTRAEVLLFSMDLSDGSLKQKPGFIRFVQNGRFDTAYYKAASYVSHNPGFYGLDRLVLSSVNHVIQSDDGIPFKMLRQNGSQWNVRLFGLYTTPGPVFHRGAESEAYSAFDQSICARAQGADLTLWKRIWAGSCTRAPHDLGFASLIWDGTLPFRYGYTSTPRTGGWTASQKSKFSNLVILDKR